MPTILMADIVKSSRQEARTLMKEFKSIVAETNKRYHKGILSPLTITLGDEFQGVVKGLAAALEIIMDLEYQTLTTKQAFRFRYVVLEGEIQTPINHQTAHGMLGPGLTEA